MRIFVSAGTDHHPFERLVGWAERWAADHPDDIVVMQHGYTRSGVGLVNHELLTHAEMVRAIDDADVVVVSCGPGGVMDIRGRGRLPVVVARRVGLGEHVDDHQSAFARHLATTGLARCVEDEADLRCVLDDARADPAAFEVVPDQGQPPGIVRIGELIDALVTGG